jgi:predicted regulator of Ras-like GTPase activity (Roadblock/LC7/MglB family)
MITFAQLFWVLSAIGAALFFSSGFAAGRLGGLRARRAGGGSADLAASGASGEEAREPWAGELAARDAALRDLAGREAALQAECAKLRGEVAEREAALKRATLGHPRELPEGPRGRDGSLGPMIASKRGNTSPPGVVAPMVAGDAAAREREPGRNTKTSTFQAILDGLEKTKGMRCAVLGDPMGLPVASFGEQAESLAGFCGFLTHAASRARDFLSLGHIRRIAIEDDQHAILTTCSVLDADIFLATLTTGPGPELARMVQVLNDVKSFMAERSHA